MPLPGYFPNVPALPGVPPLPRLPNSIAQPVLKIELAALDIIRLFSAPPVWGVFDQSGNQVLKPDSIIDFGDRSEWNVVSFPVQAGSFASYNKVIVPAENSVKMVKGGSSSDRMAFLSSIADIAGDTNLYNIVTPERIYSNVNVTRWETTRRGAGGAYPLDDVELFFVQILQVTPQYTNTSLVTQNAQDPSALPAVNQGNVSPQTPGTNLAGGNGQVNYSGPQLSDVQVLLQNTHGYTGGSQ